MASGEINNNERKEARNTSMCWWGDNKDKHKLKWKLHKKSRMFASKHESVGHCFIADHL